MIEAMRADLSLAARGLQELLSGADTIEAEAAAVEVMGVVSLVRQYLTRS